MHALYIGCFALWVALFQDPEADLRAHYEAARQAQQAGDLTRAANEYREVVKLAPQMAEARVNLGLLYHVLGRLDESLRELGAAERLKPGLLGVALHLGIGYERLNQPRRAVPWLTKAVAQEPGRKEAHTWLASALWDAGEHEQALAELERTAAQWASDIDCLFLLGEGYRKAATALTDALLNEHPGSALSHQIRAETYAAAGRWDRAERHYQRLIQISPQYPGARAGLAVSMAAQDKAGAPANPKAADAFLAGLPAHSDAEPAAARALFDKGDYAAAARALRALKPRSDAGTYLLARTYGHLAVAALERLVALDPQSYRVHQLMAQLVEAKEDYEDALAEYRHAARLHPELNGIHYAIGNALWRLHRTDEAVPELLEELGANPNHAAANAALGTIYVRQHESAKAVPFLERALRIEPGLSAARKDLGKAFHELKRYPDAARELKLALAQDHDGSAHYVLGVVYRDMGQPAEAAKAFAEARRLKAARLADASIGEQESEDVP